MPINVEHRVPAGVLLQAAAQSGRAMGEAERVKEGRAARERQLEMLMKREESQQRTAMEGARLQAGMIEAQGRQRISQQQLELQSAELLQRQQFQAEQLENQKFAEIQDGIREGTLVYSPETQLELGNLDGRETAIMKDLALGPVGAATPARMAALDSIARLRRSLMSMPLPAPAPPEKLKGMYGDDQEYGGGEVLDYGAKGLFEVQENRSTRRLERVPLLKPHETIEGLKAGRDSAERIVNLHGESAENIAQFKAGVQFQQDETKKAEEVKKTHVRNENIRRIEANRLATVDNTRREREIETMVDQAVKEAQNAAETDEEDYLIPLSADLLWDVREAARDKAQSLVPPAKRILPLLDEGGTEEGQLPQASEGAPVSQLPANAIQNPDGTVTFNGIMYRRRQP